MAQTKNCAKRLTHTITYKYKQVNEYAIKTYKMQKNNQHTHRRKKAKYIIYQPINTCKSMRWLRLLFFD